MKQILYLYNSLFLIGFLIMGCNPNKVSLPFLGQTTVDKDDQEIHHRVGQFKHYNQDSVLVTNKDLENDIYIADFFFTSCPSICPKVAKEMLKIYDIYKDVPNIKFVSFTIDPKRDTPQKLKLYADNLGVKNDKWLFLTGDKDETLELANTYFVAAFEDADAPGGFDHSGKIILVDKDGHIRSFSEGTDPESTPKIIADIQKLSDEYSGKMSNQK